MRTMAKALIQCVRRTEIGWMTGPTGSAWVAWIDMATKFGSSMVHVSCADSINYVKGGRAGCAGSNAADHQRGETHVEDRCWQFSRRFQFVAGAPRQRPASGPGTRDVRCQSDDSTYGFCHGDPGEIGRSRMPIALTRDVKACR